MSKIYASLNKEILLMDMEFLKYDKGKKSDSWVIINIFCKKLFLSKEQQEIEKISNN